MKKANFILLADAYKYSHHKLYYPGTSKIYSYLESRGGMFDETVFYGLQYFLKEYIEGAAFSQQDLDDADGFLHQVFNRTDVFDKTKFQYILDTYNGKLPVKIKAVAEGSIVPVGNALMTQVCLGLLFLCNSLMPVGRTMSSKGKAIKKPPITAMAKG